MQCPGDGTCSNHGTCNVTTGTCNCDSGFHGAVCSFEGKKILYLVKYYLILDSNVYRYSMSR